jgi:hypothetical protein
MQTETSPYNATEYRDVLARLALQRANIMHLVDLKRGGYFPRRTEMRIGRLTDRPRSISILSKSVAPSLDVPATGPPNETVSNRQAMAAHRQHAITKQFWNAGRVSEFIAAVFSLERVPEKAEWGGESPSGGPLTCLAPRILR